MQLRRTLPIALALALALIAPAAASAAKKPGATTGGAASITPTTATLNGRVDPNNAATTYFFQLGTTSLYGVNTAVTAAGEGANGAAVSVPLTGLAPATTYHYRIVAQNRLGITRGQHKTFKTKPQPLALSLAATPNPVAPGKPTVLAGQLTGTNNASRDIVLQSNAFPYLAGFQPVGNAVVTDAAGNFAFTLLSVPVTTQFRVYIAQRPDIASAPLVVGAALRVGTSKKKTARYRHSVTVRFRGSISPQYDGGRVSIQKLSGGVWVEKSNTVASDAGDSVSRYEKSVRIQTSGKFRIVAEATGQYTSGVGRTVVIKAPR